MRKEEGQGPHQSRDPKAGMSSSDFTEGHLLGTHSSRELSQWNLLCPHRSPYLYKHKTELYMHMHEQISKWLHSMDAGLICFPHPNKNF